MDSLIGDYVDTIVSLNRDQLCASIRCTAEMLIPNATDEQLSVIEKIINESIGEHGENYSKLAYVVAQKLHDRFESYMDPDMLSVREEDMFSYYVNHEKFRQTVGGNVTDDVVKRMTKFYENNLQDISGARNHTEPLLDSNVHEIRELNESQELESSDTPSPVSVD